MLVENLDHLLSQAVSASVGPVVRVNSHPASYAGICPTFNENLVDHWSIVGSSDRDSSIRVCLFFSRIDVCARINEELHHRDVMVLHRVMKRCVANVIEGIQAGTLPNQFPSALHVTI